MSFPPSVREDALVKSSRRCCVCREFAGRASNVHHIEQEADGGSNTIENAIVLCLRCHSEAVHYNPRHPVGAKYSPSELVRHRDQLWAAVADGRFYPPVRIDSESIGSDSIDPTACRARNRGRITVFSDGITE
jgi:hypothetical protein